MIIINRIDNDNNDDIYRNLCGPPLSRAQTRATLE